MSTYDSLPPMAAEHRRLLQQQTAPPPPRPPNPRTAMRRFRATQRRAEASYNELGHRFASWARSRGYQPANYAKIGRGWKIGPLDNRRAPYVSDPGFGEAMAMMRGPTNWYVLHNGKVTTDANNGAQILGSHPDTSRFIQVVLANWDCDLGSAQGLASSLGPGAGLSQFELYVAQQQVVPGPERTADLGYASPGWDTAGFRGATARPTRPIPRRRQTLWEKILDLL